MEAELSICIDLYVMHKIHELLVGSCSNNKLMTIMPSKQLNSSHRRKKASRRKGYVIGCVCIHYHPFGLLLIKNSP